MLLKISRWLNNHRLKTNLLPVIVFFILCGSVNGKIVPENEGKINVAGVEIYYKTIGSGESIIVIHGGPGLDHSYLLPQMKKLADQHKLIFYDQCASGRSTGVVDSLTMTLDQFVADLEAVRQYFKLEKMNLMGHSWGGLLAMNYAIKYPGNMKSLILMSSPGADATSIAALAHSRASRLTPAIKAATDSLLNSEVFRNGDPIAMQEFTRLTFCTDFYNPAMLDSLNLQFSNTTAKNILPIYTSFIPYLTEYNITEDLNNITCRTLILHGDYDPIPTLFAEELQSRISNSKLTIIHESGHFPFIENPKQLFTGINHFLKK